MLYKKPTANITMLQDLLAVMMNYNINFCLWSNEKCCKDKEKIIAFSLTRNKEDMRCRTNFLNLTNTLKRNGEQVMH